MKSIGNPLRMFLVVVIAWWPSLCFCQAAGADASLASETGCCEASGAAAPVRCPCCGDGHGPAKHTHGPKCACSEGAGVLAKPGATHSGVPGLALEAHPAIGELGRSFEVVRSAVMESASRPRFSPATSLLRLHCALTI